MIIRRMKNLDGFFEVLAPKIFVFKPVPTAIIIKDAMKKVNMVENSNIAKFESKEENNSGLLEC